MLTLPKEKPTVLSSDVASILPQPQSKEGRVLCSIAFMVLSMPPEDAAACGLFPQRPWLGPLDSPWVGSSSCFFLSLLPSGTEVQERELHSQFSLSQPALHNFPSEARLLSHEQLVLMTSDRGSRTGIPVRSVVKITQSCLTLCYPPHGLYSPWNSLGENTGMGSHCLLHEIFPT